MSVLGAGTPTVANGVPRGDRSSSGGGVGVPASPFPGAGSSSPAAAAFAAAHAAIAASPHRHTPLLGHGTADQTQQRLRRSQLPPTAASAGAAAGGHGGSPARSSHGASAAAASSAVAASAAPLSPLPLPPSQLSCHASLSLHLDDYVALLDSLFRSLDPALAMAHMSAASGVQGAAAATAASNSAQASSDVWMRKLLRKDALLQESLRGLIEHQRLQRRLQAQYDELAALDAGIIDFCAGLSSLEQRLLQASSADQLTLATPATAVSLAATAGAPPHPSSYSLRSLLRLSESLGRMSVAPSFFIEQRMDSFNPAVCRPPVPLDKVIQHSLLHHEPQQLLALVEEERRNKEQQLREAETKATEQAAAPPTGEEAAMMTDVDGGAAAAGLHPSSALGRQESAQSTTAAMPSFAEVSAQSGFGTPHMQRQDSAHRAAAAAAAPVALDLDLDTSDEEDEDD